MYPSIYVVNHIFIYQFIHFFTQLFILFHNLWYILEYPNFLIMFVAIIYCGQFSSVNKNSIASWIRYLGPGQKSRIPKSYRFSCLLFLNSIYNDDRFAVWTGIKKNFKSVPNIYVCVQLERAKSIKGIKIII